MVDSYMSQAVFLDPGTSTAPGCFIRNHLEIIYPTLVWFGGYYETKHHVGIHDFIPTIVPSRIEWDLANGPLSKLRSSY